MPPPGRSRAYRVTVLRILVIALITASGVTAAHHSQAMFTEAAVWVTGTIVRYRAVDPHAMIELHEPQAQGPGRKWIIEGPRRGRLERILQNSGGIQDDQLLQVGDRISVCGFPLKKDFSPERMYADWPPEQGRFVHGQLIVLRDGRMQSWGPYGRLDHCVRVGDRARVWAAFLDRDVLAHAQWCAAMRDTRQTRDAPRTLFDEINRGLKTQCP